ncbi:MAG: hypothetical protein JW981_05555, partial [Anaerolineae bacterium]|nr:hypothetical protein [Anaerolineae bacterium]
MQEAPEKKQQEKPKIGQIVLWVLVILSLSLNGMTIYALLQARNAAVAAVASAQVTIARISQEPIRTVVSINQDIP